MTSNNDNYVLKAQRGIKKYEVLYIYLYFILNIFCVQFLFLFSPSYCNMYFMYSSVCSNYILCSISYSILCWLLQFN